MAPNILSPRRRIDRRTLLRGGLYGLGVSAGLPMLFSQTAAAMTQSKKPGATAAETAGTDPNRILVAPKGSEIHDRLTGAIVWRLEEAVMAQLRESGRV